MGPNNNNKIISSTLRLLRVRLVHVFENWKLLFENIYGNTCGWKSVWKYVKYCLKTKNYCLKIQTKHPLKHSTHVYFLEDFEPKHLIDVQHQLRNFFWIHVFLLRLRFAFFFFFFTRFDKTWLLFMYCSMNSNRKCWLFCRKQCIMYCSWTHKFHFLVTFSLKMGPTVLFTHLKIILLQWFQQ